MRRLIRVYCVCAGLSFQIRRVCTVNWSNQTPLRNHLGSAPDRHDPKWVDWTLTQTNAHDIFFFIFFFFFFLVCIKYVKGRSAITLVKNHDTPSLIDKHAPILQIYLSTYSRSDVHRTWIRTHGTDGRTGSPYTRMSTKYIWRTVSMYLNRIDSVDT